MQKSRCCGHHLIVPYFFPFRLVFALAQTSARGAVMNVKKIRNNFGSNAYSQYTVLKIILQTSQSGSGVKICNLVARVK